MSGLFSPPPGDDTAATLRWVRRLEFLTAAAALLVAAVLWAIGIDVWWWAAIIGGVSVLGAAMVTPAIRRAESESDGLP